ncbi:GNAT family N-acetyltransferase [Myceligenerans xiligouense]|uniref:Ribosomal protein S18 acetylase RimI-like enzyme n=1 Tax=Myceligenerans xiligouense TaxID=253184 RepID=A0A3N4YV06_9MICO|nr:GNAT family N-acetyltransferase [Myceligenerans xiligouense]RPF23224.1 ribosomal protein S18 acetylase RimI-like enzyme [Myceligenerans xiligouense]
MTEVLGARGSRPAEAGVERVPFEHPDAVELRLAAVAELAERYGDDGDAAEYFDPATIVATVVIRVGGVAAAGGSVRDLSGADDGVDGLHPPGTGEVKRVFVGPGFRRRGLSTLIMGELEKSAREAGLARLVLETGTEQPEAIALYEKLGYERIAPYGKYAGEPEQRCYGKAL